MPPKPAPPLAVVPNRPPAAHLKAAVAQAKLSAGVAPPRPAAAHVRVAVAAVQGKPPVAQARTIRAAQAKLPAAPPVIQRISVPSQTSGRGAGPSRSRVIQMARIRDLIQNLRDAGFSLQSTHGSHRRYVNGSVNVNLAYHNEADETKSYQESEVRQAIESAAGGGEEAETKEAESTGPLSAYDDPTTTRESRRLIERGLAEGCYPPRS